MDPTDFVTLAIKLSSSRREAELRTAVSRAYYGAFHFAARFLNGCGLSISGKELYGAQVHVKVRHCLDAAQCDDAALASEKLASLREQRNTADYHLDASGFATPQYAAGMIQIAQQIIDCLERCSLEPVYSEARENIRTYARDVLRLNVQEND